MEQNPKPAKICQVCNGECAASLCYGIIVCASCRVFFIRTIRSTKLLVCKLSNNCQITSTSLNCSSCRYGKCIKMGLRAVDVGKREKHLKVVDYLNSFHFNQRRSEISLNLLPSGLKNISNLQNATSARDFADILFYFEQWTSNLNGKSATDFPVNINVSLADILTNPTTCTNREASVWDRSCNINPKKSYSYLHTYCRFATMFADFLNSIPQFHEFSFADKLKCYQQSFTTNLMMSVQYGCWKIPSVSNRSSAISRVDRFSFTPEEKDMYADHLFNVSSVYEKSVFPIFYKLDLTNQEWMMLKMISMFYSVDNCSDKGAENIASLRTSYSSILAKLIEEMNPNLTEEEKLTRLGQILSTVKIISMVGSLTNQFHSSFVAANRAKLKGNLPFDIHVRQL